jgi:hypothetical protein
MPALNPRRVEAYARAWCWPTGALPDATELERQVALVLVGYTGDRADAAGIGDRARRLARAHWPYGLDLADVPR